MPARASEVSRKRATVMFVDILGFTAIDARLGTEAAYAAVSGCLRLLDTVARRHQGAVDKYLGDSLMILFGGLDQAPEPEARALRAALEMRDTATAYRGDVPGGDAIDVQIGINSGFVTIGEVGASVVREFAIMGDAVNVAARLESKAGPGRIFVGSETREAAGDAFGFAEIEPLSLKGKSRPVPAFELLHSGPPQRSRLDAPKGVLATGPLRGAEPFDDLAATFDSMRVGATPARALWLEGGPGSGKTRFASELARRIVEDGNGRLLYSAPAPGAALRSFAALADSGFSDPVALEPTALEEAFAERADDEPPRLYVFDELDRTDGASLDLLARLVRPDAPLAHPMLLLSRDAPGARFAAIEHRSLPPIGAVDARRLVRDADPESGLSEEDVDLIVARAGGNPATLLRGPAILPALRADADRNEDADDASQAERRRATVLFADLSGFTAMSERLDPALAYDLVTDCLGRLDSVAVRWGGTVEKHLGDCVLALFGVPRAIEDAPRAAINAAIEMRRAVEEFNRDRGVESPLSIHVGIDTGTGIRADISGPLIREFAMMGDSIGRANALTDAAQSWEVFVGEETWNATREDFRFEERESFELPVSTRPIRPFSVLSDRPQRHRRRSRGLFSELVGRDAEIETARRALSDLHHGRGNVLEIVGEAGLGKSRLLEELRVLAAPQSQSQSQSESSSDPAPVRWLDARSLSTGQALRYHPFADAIHQWLGVSPDEEEAQIRSALDRQLDGLLGDDDDAVRATFERVLGFGSTAEASGGEAMSKVVLNDFTRWLRALAAERPTVLVFEDLHWADGSSIDLLEGLLRLGSESGLLFVLLSRPGYVESYGRISDHIQKQLDGSWYLPLSPLDRDGSRQLLRNLFGGAEVPPKIRNGLVDRAAGNPFFLEEAIRSLLEEGALEMRDDAIRATEALADAEIPGSVQEVIMARLDRLDRPKRSFLQVASVMGVNFFLRVVEEVLEKEESHALTEALVEADILAHADALAGLEFAFKHPLIQEVTYDSMLEEQRVALHAEVGRAIESVLTDNVAGYHAMLAFHFGRGQEPELAEPHLFAAGEEAARSAASNEALQFFREASELYTQLHADGGDPSKRARLEGHMATALLNRGQLGESVEHFDRALAFGGLREARSLPGRLAAAVRDLAGVLARVYLPVSSHRLRRATPAEAERFELMFRRAIADSTSDPTRFLVDSLAVTRRVAWREPRSVPDSAAVFAGAIGIFSFGAGLFGVGGRLLELAQRVAAEGGIAERELYFRVLGFLHYSWSGDWRDENCVPDELLQRGLSEGRLWEVSTYLDIETDRRIRRGEFALAEERLEQLTEVADLYQHELAWSAVRAQRTFLALERRQLDAAAHWALAYCEEHDDVPIHLYALGERAKIEILQERLDDADRTLATCDRLVREGGNIAAFHRTTSARSALLLPLVRAESARARGSEVDAKRALRDAKRALGPALRSARGIASRRSEILRLAGRSHWLAGRRAKAFDFWKQSHAAAETQGARPEAARLHAELALRLATNELGPNQLDGAEHRARAEASFDDLGLEADRERLDAGLAP